MARIWKRDPSDDAAETPIRPLMSLDQAPAGCPLQMVTGHHERKLALRLAEMGLTPGTEFSIIQKSGVPVKCHPGHPGDQDHSCGVYWPG